MSSDKIQFEPKQRLVMRPIRVTELGEVKVYEVMENDLTTFEAATEEERNAVAFFTFCAGVFVPLIPTWPVGENNALKIGLHFGTAIASGIMALFFLVQVFIKRRKRAGLVERLRSTPRSIRVDATGAARPATDAPSTAT